MGFMLNLPYARGYKLQAIVSRKTLRESAPTPIGSF
jgi:hypothetical protein